MMNDDSAAAMATTSLADGCVRTGGVGSISPLGLLEYDGTENKLKYQ